MQHNSIIAKRDCAHDYNDTVKSLRGRIEKFAKFRAPEPACDVESASVIITGRVVGESAKRGARRFAPNARLVGGM
jgi:hypothetical protein